MVEDESQAWGVARRRMFMLSIAVAIYAGIAVAHQEFYPFTDAALFIDAPQRIATYDVTDATGEVVPAEVFALRSYYFGLRGFIPSSPGPAPGALSLPESDVVMGEVLSEAALQEIVRRRWPASLQTPRVVVRRRVFGPLDDARFGLISSTQVVIDAPEESP